VFHDFKQQKGEPMLYRQHRYTLAELEFAAWKAAKLSRACQRFADHLEREGIIPEMSIGDLPAENCSKK
jgi:hypothetical protein